MPENDADQADQMRTKSPEDQEPPVTTPPPPPSREAQAAQDDEEHQEMEGARQGGQKDQPRTLGTGLAQE